MMPNSFVVQAVVQALGTPRATALEVARAYERAQSPVSRAYLYV